VVERFQDGAEMGPGHQSRAHEYAAFDDPTGNVQYLFEDLATAKEAAYVSARDIFCKTLEFVDVGSRAGFVIVVQFGIEAPGGWALVLLDVQ
jgi:hypothetical protein